MIIDKIIKNVMTKHVSISFKIKKVNQLRPKSPLWQFLLHR